MVALTGPPIIGLAAYFATCRFSDPLTKSYQGIYHEIAQLLEDFQSETINRVLHGVSCFRVRHAKWMVSLGETMCYMGAKVSANIQAVYDMITVICKPP